MNLITTYLRRRRTRQSALQALVAVCKRVTRDGHCPATFARNALKLFRIGFVKEK